MQRRDFEASFVRVGLSSHAAWQTSRCTVLRAHADAIAAADFFTTEVWTARGLVAHSVLFAIDDATRAVQIAGITTNPDSAFIVKVARKLTDHVDGFLRGKRFLIVDRDSKFTEQFCRILHDAAVEVVRTCYQAANMNAFAERCVQSVKREFPDRMILFGESHLRRVVSEYVALFITNVRTRGSATS